VVIATVVVSRSKSKPNRVCSLKSLKHQPNQQFLLLYAALTKPVKWILEHGLTDDDTEFLRLWELVIDNAAAICHALTIVPVFIRHLTTTAINFLCEGEQNRNSIRPAATYSSKNFIKGIQEDLEAEQEALSLLIKAAFLL